MGLALVCRQQCLPHLGHGWSLPLACGHLFPPVETFMGNLILQSGDFLLSYPGSIPLQIRANWRIQGARENLLRFGLFILPVLSQFLIFFPLPVPNFLELYLYCLMTEHSYTAMATGYKRRHFLDR